MDEVIKDINLLTKKNQKIRDFIELLKDRRKKSLDIINILSQFKRYPLYSKVISELNVKPKEISITFDTSKIFFLPFNIFIAEVGYLVEKIRGQPTKVTSQIFVDETEENLLWDYDAEMDEYKSGDELNIGDNIPMGIDIEDEENKWSS